MLTTKDQLEVLISLFHRGKKITYSKGDYIIPPGNPPPGVFYIESGLVKAYDITKYGEENLLIIRKTGEFLGLTKTLSNEHHPIIYQTLSDTTVWLLSQQTFVLYLRSHPEAGLPLIDMLTDMYRLHSDRIICLEYRTVRERLISFLLTTSQRFGKPTPEGILIDVPLRHQDIASSINSSRETTSRELAYLDRKGLVQSKQSYILLKDVEALRTYL